jgi:hypothetical protein
MRQPADHGQQAEQHLPRKGSMTHLYCVVPVTDRAAALEWFAVFFGQPADEVFGSEVLWQVSETAWVVVDEHPEQAGHALLTLGWKAWMRSWLASSPTASVTSRWRPTTTACAMS